MLKFHRENTFFLSCPPQMTFKILFSLLNSFFFGLYCWWPCLGLCLFLLLYKESNAFTTYFLQKLFMVFSANSFSFIQEVCYPIQWIFCGRPFLVFLYFHPYLKGLLAHEIILDLLYYLHPLFEGNICSIQGLSLQKTILNLFFYHYPPSKGLLPHSRVFLQ